MKSTLIRSITLQKRGIGADARLVVLAQFANGVDMIVIDEPAGGIEGEIFHTVHSGGLERLRQLAMQAHVVKGD